MKKVLSDIRIVDLTQHLAGPFCTMLLADMGADVLRIEGPGSPTGRRAQQAGEAGTSLPPILLAADSPYSAHQRNKKSLALNLKMEEAKDAKNKKE